MNAKPVRILLEVNGGILQSAIIDQGSFSGKRIKMYLIDWDNITDGKQNREAMPFPDAIVSENKFNELLKNKEDR